MLVVAAGVAILGWCMAHNPTRVLRVFTLGVEPAFGGKFVAAFLKICGWVFCSVMSAGVVLYAILSILDIIHGR